jgi:SAM-dependent methyltransferase
MHRNTKLLFQKFARPYFSPGLKVLEIGPNRTPSELEGIVALATEPWHSLDIARSCDRKYDRNLTYSTDSPYQFPIPDGYYDVVVSSNVIEHVGKIWRWLPEVARIVRPGGRVITISPISWEFHEDPVDCWRIYPDGMRALCEDAGLNVELCEWDALGIENLRKIGGRVQLWQKLSGILNLLHWKLGFPWEAAFDLITICQKPAS